MRGMSFGRGTAHDRYVLGRGAAHERCVRLAGEPRAPVVNARDGVQQVDAVPEAGVHRAEVVRADEQDGHFGRERGRLPGVQQPPVQVVDHVACTTGVMPLCACLWEMPVRGNGHGLRLHISLGSWLCNTTGACMHACMSGRRGASGSTGVGF